MTEVEVRLALYKQFVETGRSPSAAQLGAMLGRTEAAVRDAFERLAEERAIVLQPESREILFAPPLSAIPTAFVVHTAGRSYFAPCAWDALGSVAMLGGTGEVEASCACCGEGIRLRVEDGVPTDPGWVVHFAIPARQWWSDLVFT